MGKNKKKFSKKRIISFSAMGVIFAAVLAGNVVAGYFGDRLPAAREGLCAPNRTRRNGGGRYCTQAAERGGAAAAFFKRVSRGLTAGEQSDAVWRRAAVELPLSGPERNALLTLAEAAQGDEESACKGISLVRKTLEESLRQMEKQRMEEDRRSAALCFSAAALTVILLI